MINIINNITSSIISYKSYVMLPIFMLILSLIIGLKKDKALKASMTLGIGFIGIFIVFDYFVSKTGPVLEILVKNTGLKLNVLDVGWPPLAGIAWSFKYVPLLIILILVVNVIMLIFKWTSVINIDLWNFWHFIFTAQLVYTICGNFILSISAGLFASALTLKLGDYSAHKVEEFSNLKGVAITTLSGLTYFPIAIVLDKILCKVPGINKIKADPDEMKRKLGFFGEPMFIGFLMGLILGICAKLSMKDTLELGLNIAAVVFILPKMCGILGEGLMPISSAMNEYMTRKFPNIKDTYIGLNLSVIVGNPSAIVTGILLMPVAIILSLVLPGIKFIPLGDLPNIINAVVMIVVACNGNIIRAFIVSIPVLISMLYIASSMAGMYTNLAYSTGYKISSYSGTITSFLDGGNIMRFWIVKLFTGKLWALFIIPVVIYILYQTRKVFKYESLKK